MKRFEMRGRGLDPATPPTLIDIIIFRLSNKMYAPSGKSFSLPFSLLLSIKKKRLEKGAAFYYLLNRAF
jgi:hypothetical protein